MMAKETYTLVKAADRSKEHFPDAKSAAEAFSKANAAERLTVVKTVEGQGANFVAGTTEKRGSTEQEFSKWVGQDKEFRDAWQKAEYVAKERVIERDQAAGIKHGMMRIDGLQAHEVRVFNRTDDTSKTQLYDVEFYKNREMPNGSSFAKNVGIDRQELAAVIGDKNAHSVDEASKRDKSPVVLSGEQLAYTYGSNQEKAQREYESAPVDFNKLEKAEVGKTYRGPVMAVTSEIIVQRHTDEKTGRQVDIAHDKANVFNYADKQGSIGKSHQIAYPHSKSGFARELQQSELQKAPAPQQEAGKDANKTASIERAR